MQIGTIDSTFVGSHVLKIKVLEASAVVNESVTFTVVINSITKATSITSTGTLPALTYVVGAAAISADLPVYTWVPSAATTSFSYSITAGPGYVTIAGSPPKINIYTTSLVAGTFTVTIKTTETGSGLFDQQSFTLVV